MHFGELTRLVVAANFVFVFVNGYFVEPFIISPTVPKLFWAIRSLLIWLVGCSLMTFGLIYFDQVINISAALIFLFILHLTFVLSIRKLLIFSNKFLLLTALSISNFVVMCISIYLSEIDIIDLSATVYVVLLVFCTLGFVLSSPMLFKVLKLKTQKADVKKGPLKESLRLKNLLSWLIDFLPSNIYVFALSNPNNAFILSQIRTAQLLFNPIGQFNGLISNFFFSLAASENMRLIKWQKIKSRLLSFNIFVVSIVLLAFYFYFNVNSVQNFDSLLIYYILPTGLIPVVASQVTIERARSRVNHDFDTINRVSTISFFVFLLAIGLINYFETFHLIAYVMLSYFVFYVLFVKIDNKFFNAKVKNV